MLNPLTKIAAGIALAAVLACGVLGYWLSNVIESRAVLRHANEANLKAIDRLEADQVINEAIAIADATQRRRMEDDAAELERAAANANQDCPNDGLSLIIEQRRLQRSRGGNEGR